MIRLLAISILLISLSIRCYSQKLPIHCATMEQDSINRQLYPQLGELDEFEKHIQQKIKEIEFRKQSQRVMEEVITIPVIVHVINKGETIGTGSNISEAQVQSQLEVLNEDFRKKVGTRGENSSPIGADIEIEFCLAAFDESGKPMSEKGIDRYNGNRDKWTRKDIEGILKPSTSWDPDKYFNIWCLDIGGEDERILGYAQFPSQSNLPGLQSNSGPASTDGVVISYRHFGSSDKGDFPSLQAPYNKGRTLTHETGHWLGLRHIWGDGGCGADDFVNDTPDADGPSSGCNKNRISCGVRSMVENYMDYSEDACMNIFTNGQKTRMRAVMEISPRRVTLLSSNVCAPTVASKPNANFRADKTFILRGASVVFNDISSNFPNKWLWTFEGGNPSTSTLKNPEVEYTESDTFKVSLIATNALGSDTIIREKYIIVSQQGICSDTTNFHGTDDLLPLPVENEKGYLSGHNSLKHTAKAEFFENSLGYAYVSKALLKFGKAYASEDDATVTVTVWNARGPQSAPGAVVEETEVLIKRIQEDIENDRATEVVFTRLSPLFGRGFYVGIQLSYEGDTVALNTTQDGEASQVTAWQFDETNTWRPYAIAYGVNVAHDIRAFVGMNPAVQISSSALYVQSGEKVTLNAKGASIFSWSDDQGDISEFLGAQLTVRPSKTTTYTVQGAGLDLCQEQASLTVFVNTLTGVDEELNSNFKIYPNPTPTDLKIKFSNDYYGLLDIEVINALGEKMSSVRSVKKEKEFSQTLNVKDLSSGVYILHLKSNNVAVIKKFIKIN